MSDFWDNINNPDGSINLNHPVFQQGRNLYDSQVLLATLDNPDKKLLEKVLHEYCRLINIVGHLTYEHKILKENNFRNKLMKFIESNP